ncbi:MAG: hypothetical protein MJB14_08030 [Spirochaetes bacterium]|nr:hypothetical protein [Spirochaetota bacterium]
MRVFILLLILFLMFSCQYEDPFAQYDGQNLLAGDSVSDWSTCDGITITTSAETPPAGYSQAYSLELINLITNGTFEGSTSTADWTNPESIPVSRFYVKTDGAMTGTNYLYLNLIRDTTEERIYDTFSAAAGDSYTFKFDYQHISGEKLQISYGVGAADADQFTSIISSGSSATLLYNIPIFTTDANYEIRFGFAETPDDAANYEVHLDEIQLFINSNHAIDTQVNNFEAGVYQLSVYAKQNTNDQLGLILGSESENYTLSSSWKEYTLEANFNETYSSIDISILPTFSNGSDSNAGSIYITDAKLYFLPEQAYPDNS